MGRIIWANGGYHPHRSWLRYLEKNCPKINLDKNIILYAQKYQCWRYRILAHLYKIQEINSKEFTAIINSLIEEITFDILQEEKKDKLIYSKIRTSASKLLEDGLTLSLITLDPDLILQKSKKQQLSWSSICNGQLDYYSPHLAPRIENIKGLKAAINQDLYQKFIKFLNGQNTLRDLATIFDREVEVLSCSLISYINEGLLKLEKISDLPNSSISLNHSRDPQKKIRQEDYSKPVIACIDDSLQVQKIMEQIILKQDCHFIGIQNSLEVIPHLVRCKPDLIFLDLGMPVINGYEVCQQLKCVSALKDIPIIILTAQNTIIDRIKAKMLGSSEFIVKPITISTVINVLNNYL